MFVTPPSALPGEPTDNKRKREEARGDLAGAEAASASPDMKKGKTQTMKRTPQPTLAQSRLTTAGGTLKIHQAVTITTVPQAGAGQPDATESLALGSRHGAPEAATAMDTTPATDTSANAGQLIGAGPVPLTADFFRNLIGENTKMVTEKIETLSEDLLTLSK